MASIRSACLDAPILTGRNTLANIAGEVMAEPLIRVLDSVHIDDDRRYIEFRFRDRSAEQVIRIDFQYVESLAALFQQAFVSAALAVGQGGNRWHGRDYLSVPRVDVDHPISVAVDVMTDRVVLMFLLGTPFQVSYSVPVGLARMLATDVVAACEHVERQPDGRSAH
jgi:hypothetical protein